MVIYKRLEEVCDILDSQRIPITASDRTKGIYPYYGANGIQDYVDDYIFDDELVLLAEDGGNFGSTGKPIAYRVSGKCWVNNHAHVLKAKNIIDTDYLCLALMFYNTDGLVNGATRQKLTQKAMRSMIIPVRSCEDQQRIKLIIQKVFSLIESHKKQIEKLDELIKSRFVEMFGDTYSNPMKWKRMTFRQVSVRLSDGPFGSNLKTEHYSESGIRVIRLGNIGVGEFIDKDKSYIPNEHYERLKKYTCRAGEIVIGTLGNPNLRACRIPNFIEIAVNKADCVHFIPDEKKLNIAFACQYINCPETLILASSMAHGQTRTRISSGQIAELSIYLPPLPLQQQFADFVAQTDKSKLAVKKQIEKLETLKKSLMQEYFG